MNGTVRVIIKQGDDYLSVLLISIQWVTADFLAAKWEET